MELSNKQRLMIVFLSIDNPLWKRILDLHSGRVIGGIEKADIEEIAGLSRQTPANWRVGRTMRKSKSDSVFPRVLTFLERSFERASLRGRADEGEFQSLHAAVQAVWAAYQQDQQDIYSIASALGMPPATCQQVLDAAIYDRWPLLRSVYYPKALKCRGCPDLAKMELDRYEGIYLVWVRRGSMWLQCVMRVRYLQDGGAGRFIRCKLNFPIIGSSEMPLPICGQSQTVDQHWAYDGFLVVRAQHLNWTFEKRLLDRNDYFHFITSVESTTGNLHPTLTGQYLTTGQDARQTVVSGSLLIRRLFTEGEDPLHLRYRELMANGPKVLTSEAEVREANERWEQFHRASSAGVAAS